MKISLIIPPQVQDWQGNIIPELKQLRHLVLVNNCDETADMMIGMSHTQWQTIDYLHKKYPKVPLITLNWDWYDYVNKTIDGWTEFTQLMRESIEVWTSSKAEAVKCEKETGIKSDVYTYAFILPWEWEGETRDYGYIFQGEKGEKLMDNKMARSLPMLQKEFKEHLREGKAYYKNKLYEEAIEEWEKARALYPKKRFIGRLIKKAEKKLGKKRKPGTKYDKYRY